MTPLGDVSMMPMRLRRFNMPQVLLDDEPHRQEHYEAHIPFLNKCLATSRSCRCRG